MQIVVSGVRHLVKILDNVTVTAFCNAFGPSIILPVNCLLCMYDITTPVGGHYYYDIIKIPYNTDGI